MAYQSWGQGEQTDLTEAEVGLGAVALKVPVRRCVRLRESGAVRPYLAQVSVAIGCSESVTGFGGSDRQASFGRVGKIVVHVDKVEASSLKDGRAD